MSKDRIDRNKTLADNYKKLLRYQCANPGCPGGAAGIDAHHIVPLSEGGADAYWNLVCLCTRCHRISGLHSNYESWRMTLSVWKSKSEIRTLGFFMDEEEAGFPERYGAALRKAGLEGEAVARMTLRGLSFGDKGEDAGNA